MASLLALALAGSLGGFLLHILNPPREPKTATDPGIDPRDAGTPPLATVPVPLPVASPVPLPVASPVPPPLPPPVVPVPPVPLPVPSAFAPPVPTTTPATTSDPLDATTGSSAPAPFIPPARSVRPAVRRPAPLPAWERHPFAAAGKLALFVAALGASGAVAVASGIALLARSLR